jgi:hypothetical protein
VSNRTLITPRTAPTGPRGDVRPEPVTIGTKLRHLVRTAVPAANLGGGQDGRQAFAVDQREVPT